MSISVVIPTCDRPLWVQRALRSVFGQTHRPGEVIVVDNGTMPVPPELLPKQVNLIRLKSRAGASTARNTGAEQAAGDYIAFLDDDDEWTPDYLEQMHRAILAEETMPDLLVGRKDAIVNGDRSKESCLCSSEGLLPELLVCNPGIGGQNILVRRDSFLAIGGFDPELSVSEDRALAIDFLRRGGRLLPVPQAIVILHRGRNDHLSKSSAMLQGTRTFYRKYRPLMTRQARLANRAKILTYCATQNRNRNWPLSKLQRLGARFLRYLARQEILASHVPSMQSEDLSPEVSESPDLVHRPLQQGRVRSSP